MVTHYFVMVGSQLRDISHVFFFFLFIKHLEVYLCECLRCVFIFIVMIWPGAPAYGEFVRKLADILVSNKASSHVYIGGKGGFVM